MAMMRISTEELVSLIARAAGSGSAVALPDAPTALAEGLQSHGVAVDEQAEVAVLTALPKADDLVEVGRACHTILAPASEAELREFLEAGSTRGFFPDPSFLENGTGTSGWVVLRRQETPLHRRIDALEGLAADLERERRRLREQLRRVNLELEDVKTSPAWEVVGRYRKWLERNRQKKSVPFRVYDQVTAALVRTGIRDAKPARSRNRERSGGFRNSGTVASVRFTPFAETADDWRRVFRGLANHAGVRDDIAQPTFSILTPLWNTKPEWLAEAAVSLFDQSERNWEWCLVDDGSPNPRFAGIVEALTGASARIRFTRLERNAGISAATNAALQMARGEYVACLDHDDLLHPDALRDCLNALVEGYDAVYTDSDKADEDGVLSEPFYKPDWSPEYFRAVMYVGHLLVVRRENARAIGGFLTEFDGVQDFEFFLRYSERYPKIAHLPRVLYHWRKVRGSLAAVEDAKDNISPLQQRAVAGQLQRLGLPAKAMAGARPHRVAVKPLARKTAPRISILIPTRDASDVLSKCLSSIFKRTTYPDFQVICADNETEEKAALDVMKRPGVDRLLCPGKFNFSRVNNMAAELADGEFLVFLNNDIEVLTRDWLEQMLYHAEQPDVGAVGALLLFPDRTIQHCGIALGFRGTADHILRQADSTSEGYAGSVAYARECSAVTAACLMIRKSLFHEIGGFNEHYFTAYQDVDLCLRLHAMGKRNVYTPRATLFHHESYTRKEYYDWVDRTLLLDSWEHLIESGDPFYNVNFDRAKTDYQVSAQASDGKDPRDFQGWALSGSAG